MKSKLSYLFILLFVISCSQENTTVGENDLSSRTYFNEFMPCQAASLTRHKFIKVGSGRKIILPDGCIFLRARNNKQ